LFGVFLSQLPDKQIPTSLRCLSKGAEKDRIRAEMQQLIEDERLNEHEHIYTDGLLKEELIGLCGSNAFFHA
jgi:hypothetical protein